MGKTDGIFQFIKEYGMTIFLLALLTFLLGFIFIILNIYDLTHVEDLLKIDVLSYTFLILVISLIFAFTTGSLIKNKLEQLKNKINRPRHLKYQIREDKKKYNIIKNDLTSDDLRTIYKLAFDFEHDQFTRKFIQRYELYDISIESLKNLNKKGIVDIIIDEELSYSNSVETTEKYSLNSYWIKIFNRLYNKKIITFFKDSNAIEVNINKFY